MKLKIAVVQFDSTTHEPKKNLRKAEIFLKKASEKGADVIIFPEDFITAPILYKPELIDDKYIYRDYFIKLAKKYRIDIVVGSFLEKDKTGFYNTCYYIDFKGNIKHRYRKVNLWLPERKFLAFGNEVRVFNTRFGKVGIALCWDLAFPEIFRKMAAQGVKIVYCPSWWGTKDSARVSLKYDSRAEEKFVKTLCTARAMESGIILVYCNSAGEISIGNYYNELLGRSQIAVPFRGVQKILDHNKEEMFIEEVDTKIILDHEKAYKTRADLAKRIL